MAVCESKQENIINDREDIRVSKNNFKILIIALSVILLVVILVASMMLQQDSGIPNNGGTTSSSQTESGDNDEPIIEIEPDNTTGTQKPTYGMDIPFDDF